MTFVYLIVLLHHALTMQVVLSVAEHHSMIVPWQIVAQKTGAILKFVSLTESEVADMEQLKNLLCRRTKLVAVNHISNMLGEVSRSVKQIFKLLMVHSIEK